MKTLAITLLIIGFTTFSFSQEKISPQSKFPLKPGKIEFKSDSLLVQFYGKNALNNWEESLLAQNDLSLPKFNPNLTAANLKADQSGPTNFSSAMPIYKPDQNYSMPIMKPDSTIHYHIMVKKFDVIKRNENYLP